MATDHFDECTHAITALTLPTIQFDLIWSPDHCLRLWDPRMKSESLLLQSLKSHKQWVSGVCWAPYNEFLLSSVSYDGTIKVWDTRAAMPLHTVVDSHLSEFQSFVLIGKSKTQ